MSKLSWEVMELKVTESGDHDPCAVLYRGRLRRVEDVLGRWCLSQEWWKHPVERDYYWVRLEGGVICELFRDLVTGSWHLQRVHD